MITLQFSLIADLFTQNEIAFVWRQSPGNESAAQVVIPKEIVIEPFSMFISAGNLWSMGSFSYSQSTLPPETTVGRYCSLANAISAFHSEHPIHFTSTSPFSYRPDAAPIFSRAIETSPYRDSYVPQPYDDKEDVPITIGNDVWIGQNVILKKGIHIHDGAVVAAGSVVTKDVPEFTIVGGVPAKPIKKRFSDKLIKKIKEIRWWRYNFMDFQDLDPSDPEFFLAGLQERITDGSIQPFSPESTTIFSIKTHLEHKSRQA